MIKTNVMRLLDSNKINYKIYNYDISDNNLDGISVSKKINKDALLVYKTLVTIGDNKIYVFIINVLDELNMKKAAKACGVKKIEMIRVKDILKYTGYIKGGCSPLAMKKQYITIVSKSVLDLETIIISAGKVGWQVEVGVSDLVSLLSAKLDDVSNK